MAENNELALFYGVTFCIVPSEDLKEDTIAELKDTLLTNGADYVPPLPSGRINDIRQHSHIISTHANFPEYNLALDSNVHVITPSWVHQSILKKRQVQTRPHSPDPALFFKDVILTCGDLPPNDQDAIIAGVLAMGGLYSSPLTKMVTHVVSLTMDHKKCTLIQEKRLDCKIILPHWFDDCLKLGKKISERPYQLPNPELFGSDVASPIRPQQLPDVAGAVSAAPNSPPKAPPTPTSSPSPIRKELSIFMSKKLHFSEDLDVNNHLAGVLEGLVHQGGGTLTGSVSDCDIYIGHYREGKDYIAASQQGKEVANLAWFYHVITQNRWANPLSKLLHYPVPRHGFPGFQDMRISISNYTGEARLYLENLCKVAGAEFTRTMKQDNTHLITAHRHSEKCEAAQEWNINIVNHLWLEESYAKCEVQSLANPRYTHFPPRTNLTEVVGQTQIDIKKVEQHYFPGGKKIDNASNGTKAPSASGTVEARPSPRKTVPASSAATAGSRETGLAASMSAITEESTVETPEPQTVKRKKGVGSDAAVRTPGATRVSDEKENETPTTSGRASKNRALNALHKQKEDIALFQKEMKRKGGVIHGGRRTSDDDDDDPPASKGPRGKKRSSEVLGDDEEGNADELARSGKHSKKARTNAADLPPVIHKLLVTGDERWLNNVKKESEDKRHLRGYGIELTQNPSECTLLCAPRILRTRKFVVALARAPIIVSTKYLDHALRDGVESGDENKYSLVDKDSEAKFNLRLKDSLARAKENGGRLLRGWTIFVTAKISSGYETFEEIIKANGGTPAAYRGRTGVSLPKRRKNPSEDPDAGAESQHQGGDEETDYVYLVSGTSDEEVKMWDTFRTMAEKQDLQARIVGTDWLLNLAMSQKVEWDPKWDLKEKAAHEGNSRKRR